MDRRPILNNILGSLYVIYAIAQKDITVEARNKDIVVSISAFGIFVSAIIVITVNLTPSAAQDIGTGILWVGISFATVLGLNRSVTQEAENNTIEGLMLAPISRDLIFLGKSLSIFLFITLSELAIVPVFAVLFNLPLWHFEMLIVFLLANLGLASLGTLFASMASKVKTREILLPTVLLPTCVPLLMAATRATTVITKGENLEQLMPWFIIAVVFDIMFFAISAVLFHFALEE